MAQSYSITKKQYDYLLPVFGNASDNPKLLRRIDRGTEKYYFIGTHAEYVDMLARCKYLND